jgi:hypothetical protein
MAVLELISLTDHLDDLEIGTVREVLEEVGSAPLDLDSTAEPAVLHAGLDDDIFMDFVDRLAALEASADIYLPSDFEDTFSAGDYVIGSAHSLLLALESLRDEFSVEDDDEDFEEDADGELAGEDVDALDTLDGESDDDPYDADGEELKDDHLRLIWKSLQRGAQSGIKQGLCLRLKP